RPVRRRRRPRGRPMSATEPPRENGSTQPGDPRDAQQDTQQRADQQRPEPTEELPVTDDTPTRPIPPAAPGPAADAAPRTPPSPAEPTGSAPTREPADTAGTAEPAGEASTADATGTTGTTSTARPAGTADPTGTAGTAPAAPAGAWEAVSASGKPEREVSREPRVSTIVWGLVVAALGALVLAVALGARPDPQLVAIGVLAGAGV